MKKNAVALPFAVGAFLLFAGCGDDVTKTTVNETGISQLAAGDEFPKCSEEESGEMLYAADSGKAYICTGKAWTPLHGESSADTVVVRDTLVQKDSVFFSQIDTLVIRDTLIGLNGESCTAVSLDDGSGVNVVCGGDTVGTILNGLKGDTGESCTLSDAGNGKVTVTCGESSVTLYKAMCGSVPYDPEKSLCKSKKLYSCNEKPYDPSESFCYGRSGSADTIVTLCGRNDYDLSAFFCYNNGAKDSIVPLCGGNEYSLDTGFCANGMIYSCNRLPYDPEKSLCKDEKLYSCDGKPYDPAESFCGKTLASKDTVLFYDTLSTSFLNQTMLASGDYGYLLDTRDGQVYRTITIGTQTWMAQNLNYRYTQGTADLDSSSFCNNNDTSYCTKYGRLYTWSAAVDSAAVFSTNGSGCGYKNTTCSAKEPVRGVCPVGWHLPSYDEMNTLLTAVGGRDGAGKMLRAASGWNSNGNGSDTYGFSALPAGSRGSIGDFSSTGGSAHFWSASEYSAGSAYRLGLYSSNSDASLSDYNKDYARSARCLKD